MVLLSDRDLIDELKTGRLQLDPFEPELVQPSSIDVRLDRLFRVFNNHLYTHIDPAIQQDDRLLVSCMRLLDRFQQLVRKDTRLAVTQKHVAHVDDPGLGHGPITNPLRQRQ